MGPTRSRMAEDLMAVYDSGGSPYRIIGLSGQGRAGALCMPGKRLPSAHHRAQSGEEAAESPAIGHAVKQISSEHH